MKWINRPLCFIVGLYRTLRMAGIGGTPVDGCDYVIEEEDIPAVVTTSKCAICGRYSVDWRRT